jgi:hypothetical protein
VFGFEAGIAEVAPPELGSVELLFVKITATFFQTIDK